MRTCRCFNKELHISVTSTLLFGHQAANKIQKVEIQPHCNIKTKRDTRYILNALQNTVGIYVKKSTTSKNKTIQIQTLRQKLLHTQWSCQYCLHHFKITKAT